MVKPNKVEILSPSSRCWKTRKIIDYLEKFFNENNIEAEFKIISNNEEFVNYDTWILPSVFINGKVVARGYKPVKERILKNVISETRINENKT